jgi:hypothetical protein
VEGVQDCEERNWNLIPFWLASPEPGKSGLTPFRSYFKDNTIERYGSHWQQLICFSVRVMWEEESYGIEFREKQKLCLEELRAMVELDDPEEDKLDEKVLGVVCGIDHALGLL